MNKKISIIIVLVVVGILVLISWGKASQNSKTDEETSTSHPAKIESSLVATETFYDFGTISMANGNVSKMFKVVNSSSEDIKVSSLITSCMCTSSYIVRPDGSKNGPFGMPGHGGIVPKANEVIKGGESREIEVIYDPNAHGPAGVGRIERAVYLEDENGKVIEFKFKVNVTP